MISLIVGFFGLALSLVSIFQMKVLLKIHRASTFKRIFTGSHAELRIVIKFFKILCKNENLELKDRYQKVAVSFIIGTILFLGAIVFVIITL